MRFIVALFLATTAVAQAPQLTPNTIKYSDTGIRNASGRSGAASIEARALLGSDGVTDVEITTASFDTTAPAPGNIDKVQVKAGLDTEEAETRNFTSLASGGVTSVRLDTLPLAPHEPIQISTSVSGIDPSRTDIVTVDEVVKRRPDLRIYNPFFPRQVITGHPATIIAFISEYNRDIGARADCVLYVDGAPVDRASGIWVDAASTVTCMMAYPFETTGPHQVQIKLENVSPADWDPSNNATYTATMIARSPADVVSGGSYDASIQETIVDTEYMAQADESQPDWENYYSHDIDRGSVTTLTATAPVQLDFANGFKASIAEWSGDDWMQSVQSNADIYVSNWPGAGCASLTWGRTFSWSACSADGVTTFSYWRGMGAARYYSRWWGVFTNYWTGDRYSYDFDMDFDEQFGARPPLSATDNIELIASDANHIWQIDPVMPIQTWSEPEQYTEGCYTSWRGPVCWWKKVNKSGSGGQAILPVPSQ